MVLTPEQNTYVLELYEKSGNSPSKATELFMEKFGRSVTPKTISHKWRKEGYKSNSCGGHRHGFTDEEIRRLHGHYKGDIGKMVEDVDRESPKGLLKRFRRLGLNVYNIPKTKSKESGPFPNYIV